MNASTGWNSCCGTAPFHLDHFGSGPAVLERYHPTRYGPRKQVAQCAAQKISDPPLRQMAGTVVDHVASLTKTKQVAQPVVGRIMIEVRSGKHDQGRSQANHLFQVGPPSNAPTSIAPCLPCLIVLSPVRQAAHSGAMRPAAPLAHAAGTLEAHPPAELTPMSRI